MRLSFSISLDDFEPISEIAENRLVGGFSNSKSSYMGSSLKNDPPANNCLGGNCASGCGVIGPFPNNGCNTTAGCGK